MTRLTNISRPMYKANVRSSLFFFFIVSSSQLSTLGDAIVSKQNTLSISSTKQYEDMQGTKLEQV